MGACMHLLRFDAMQQPWALAGIASIRRRRCRQPINDQLCAVDSTALLARVRSLSDFSMRVTLYACV